MHRHLPLIFVLLSAYAAQASVPDEAFGSKEVPGTSRPEIANDLQAFERISVSARNAVLTAERSFPQAKVVDIGFDLEHGTPVYRMRLEREGAIWDAVIDTTSSKVQRRPLQFDLSPEDRAKIDDFGRLGVDLAEAIAVGESYGAGRAVSATLDYADGRLMFLVVVLSDGYLKQVSIDPTEEALRRKRSDSTRPSQQAWKVPRVVRAPVAIK
jgi:uncharacterized membrane protein YkoI